MHEPSNLLWGHPYLFADSLKSRGTTEFLAQVVNGGAKLIYVFTHVHGNANGSRPIGQRPHYRLANPPHGVGAEPIAFAVIESLYGAHQTNVAFLNEVQQREALIEIALCDADHQPEVRLDHAPLRVLTAVLDAHRKFDFLLRRDARKAGDFAEIGGNAIDDDAMLVNLVQLVGVRCGDHWQALASCLVLRRDVFLPGQGVPGGNFRLFRQHGLHIKHT